MKSLLLAPDGLKISCDCDSVEIPKVLSRPSDKESRKEDEVLSGVPF